MYFCLIINNSIIYWQLLIKKFKFLNTIIIIILLIINLYFVKLLIKMKKSNYLQFLKIYYYAIFIKNQYLYTFKVRIHRIYLSP